MDINPFRLFPKQIELIELWRYKAPGKGNEKLGEVHAIIKRATQSNAPSEYEYQTTARRFHLKTSDLASDNGRIEVEDLVGLIIKTAAGRTYQITQASRGDDMLEGQTSFVTVEAMPYSKTSL